MDPEKTLSDLPFVENIVGMSAGDKKGFSATFPDEYEDEELAGKEVVFEVTVEKVQSRELPSID